MQDNLKQNALGWNMEPANGAEKNQSYYPTQAAFQNRLNSMIEDLVASPNLHEEDAYLIAAIVGEIGNNSFDHNLGNWPDLPGIFFAYEIEDKVVIALADRGRGVLATLKRVKPELKDDAEALKVAFTERVSGRAPESRGNGLKFVKENISRENLHLLFLSGSAQAKLNQTMEISETAKALRGCLAILSN